LSQDPSQPAQSKKCIATLAAVLLVFFAGLFVFFPGVRGDFIYDDNIDIRGSDAVFVPGGWPELFYNTSSHLYRPVKYLSYYVDDRMFGWHPAGWHWQNFFWHALNGVLVLALARRLGASLAGALLGGLWFAIHPIHAETVVWISGRSSLLSTCGLLAALAGYGCWRQKSSAWAVPVMLFAAFIGFFSKEDALMIFPVLLACEIFIRRENLPGLLKQKNFLAPVLMLGAMAAIYLGLRHAMLAGGLSQGRWENGFTGWVTTLPVILATYLRQLVWPDPMCVDQPVDYAAGFGAAFWISSVGLLLCLAVFFVHGEKWARWKFALAFFFVTLIPVMGLIPINQPRADRFLYLPSAAAALAVAWLWDLARARWRTAVLALYTAAFVWYGWRSWDYSKTFLNETVLWQNVLAVNPDSYRGYANLAAIANNSSQPERALPLVEKSLALRHGNYAEGQVIKAYALELLSKYPEAEAGYRLAITQGGEDPRWLYLLADVLQRENKYPEAEAAFDRVAELRPNYAEARFAAGILALKMNEPEKAAAHMAAVLQTDPGNKQARDILEILRRQARPPAPK
jgi:hypothetical protein